MEAEKANKSTDVEDSRNVIVATRKSSLLPRSTKVKTQTEVASEGDEDSNACILLHHWSNVSR